MVKSLGHVVSVEGIPTDQYKKAIKDGSKETNNSGVFHVRHLAGISNFQGEMCYRWKRLRKNLDSLQPRIYE